MQICFHNSQHVDHITTTVCVPPMAAKLEHYQPYLGESQDINPKEFRCMRIYLHTLLHPCLTN